MQKGLGKAWQRTEEKYNRGRGKFLQLLEWQKRRGRSVNIREEKRRREGLGRLGLGWLGLGRLRLGRLGLGRLEFGEGGIG